MLVSIYDFIRVIQVLDHTGPFFFAMIFYHRFFLIGSLFLFISNHFLQLGGETQWYIWVVTGWFFLFILHFIKVYVTDRFMNKNWERAQIERLIVKQDQKLAILEAKVQQENQA